MGIASVIHKTAIIPTTPAVRHPAKLNPSGGSVINTTDRIKGATNNPIRPATLKPCSLTPAPYQFQSSASTRPQSIPRHGRLDGTTAPSFPSLLSVPSAPSAVSIPGTPG